MPKTETATATETETALRGGRCWRFGDDLASDQLIQPQHVFDYDPKVLRRHLLEEVRPELAADAAPGDVLVTGRNFAHGSHHSHPFIAMKDMGLGLVCRSIPRGPFRLAVFMGIPLLTVDDRTLDGLGDGDPVDVDFTTGTIVNHRTGERLQGQPLPSFLLEIVAAGGGLTYARRLLDAEGTNHADR